MALDEKKEPKFEIDASVVYELGEKLISDEVQALVELVKNSYDADASYANVIVETEELVGDHSLKFSQSKGYIIIEDDGMGMDWEDITRGWLTISDSPKRRMKAEGKTTKQGRTPLGSKGLGRLGSQRLGRKIEMWTCREGSNIENYTGIDWGDFKDQILSKVPIYYEEERKKKPRRGTKIVISDLRSPNEWQGKELDELTRKLAQLLFPFEELRPFDVFLSINGRRIDLDRISKSIFDAANAKFLFSFDGKKLDIEGWYRLTFLLSTQRGEQIQEQIQQQFQRLLAHDQGANFYAFLTQEKRQSIPLKWEDKPEWFVSFHQTYALEDLGGVDFVDTPLFSKRGGEETDKKIANPGAFHGVIYSFTLEDTELSAISDVFNLKSEFKEYAKRHFGIRIYRNGFGIRPFGLDGDDWLQLGSGQTRGASWYGLRPNNVMGYVALTARDNINLEEATDREGFVENAYLRNFYRIMRQLVVKSINNVNASLRRGYNEYVKEKAEEETGITSQNMSEIFSSMRNTSSVSSNLGVRVSKTREAILAMSTRVETLTTEVETSPLFHTVEERKVTPVLQEINTTLSEANSILKQVEVILLDAKQLGANADILEADLEHLREELEQFSELAGLGITAEALSHEIKIITDNLAARTKDLLAKFKRQSPDSQVITYTEHVHTAVGRIRKQLSHLDPSLRYVHERRDKIEMYSFSQEIRDFYSERFARNNITIEIEEPSKDFTILMNKGKLTQVVDNLLLNSEYWLREDLRKKHVITAKVVMRVKMPMLEIWDTGRGIAPSIEHYLFQPFVTSKPEGRGLGLFIARQLLDASGCLILLLPERNEFDRRYIFRIDFTGALHE